MSAAGMASSTPDIRSVIGADTSLFRVTKHELAGPCPSCGGTDRFRVSLSRNLCVCSHCHDRNDHWLTPVDYVMWRRNLPFMEAKAVIEGTPFSLPPPIAMTPPLPKRQHGPIAHVYDYVDESGTVLYQVCRHEPKSFSQRRPATAADEARARQEPDFHIWRHGDGTRWVWNLDDVRRVLYRLPELLARPKATVFLPEGERDADTLVGLGLLGSTNAMGSGHWCPAYTEALRGRHVVILPDHDSAGAAHTATLTAALTGVAASLVVVTLPGESKDVTAWVAAGGTREQLETLVRDARAPKRNPRIMKLADLLGMTFPEAKEVIPGVIQEGTTLFTGKPKSGKSWTMLHFSLVVAMGGVAFGTIRVPSGDVLHLALEDGPKLLAKRFKKMLQGGKIPARVEIATEWPRLGEGGLAEIEEWLQGHPKASMVVIDTLQAIRGNDDPKKNAYRQDYDALAPITALAHRYNVGIVIVHHLRKMESSDVFDTVSGTTGLTGAVDAIVVMTRQHFTPEATLSITGRDIEEHEMGLIWDRDLAQWNYAGTGDEMRANQTQQAIMDALAGSDDPLSPRDVADQTGIDANRVKTAMWRMGQDRIIRKAGYGKYTAGASSNSGNSVTLKRENAIFGRNSSVTLAHDAVDPADKQPEQELQGENDVVTAFSSGELQSIKSYNGLSAAFTCRECGHHARSPAPWDPEQFTCAKCGVSVEGVPF